MGRFILVLTSSILFSGCAQQNMYYWGNYEQAVYAYAKNPGDVDKYVESLDAIIVTGEERNQVAPGLHAEHGFALLAIGRTDDAMMSFRKERDKWPESRRLMDLVIDGGDKPDEDAKSVSDDSSAFSNTELVEKEAPEGEEPPFSEFEVPR